MVGFNTVLKQSLRRNLIFTGAFELAVAIVALDPERSRQDVRGNFGHQIGRLQAATVGRLGTEGRRILTDIDLARFKPLDVDGQARFEETGIPGVVRSIGALGERLFDMTFNNPDIFRSEQDRKRVEREQQQAKEDSIFGLGVFFRD